MTSSGTYAFNPGADDLIIDAFMRIGIKRPSLTAEHLKDAYRQSNFLMAEWASRQPLLWRNETQEIPLLEGEETYLPLPRTVAILMAVRRTGTGQQQVDVTLGPLSTVEYAALPNKTIQGPPNSYWFNRLINPEITLYPVPDQSSTYTLVLTTVSQVQDVAITNGTTLDVPYRFLDAFTAGLAHRLARIYAPDREDKRKADAMEAWGIAASNDVESVPTFIMPGLTSYYGP